MNTLTPFDKFIIEKTGCIPISENEYRNMLVGREVALICKDEKLPDSLNEVRKILDNINIDNRRNIKIIRFTKSDNNILYFGEDFSIDIEQSVTNSFYKVQDFLILKSSYTDPNRVSLYTIFKLLNN